MKAVIHILVKIKEPICYAIPTVSRCRRQRQLSFFDCEFTMTQDFMDGLGKMPHRRWNRPGIGRGRVGSYSTGIGRDQWKTGGHSLQRGNPEWLVRVRMDEDVGIGVEHGKHLAVANVAQEDNTPW